MDPNVPPDLSAMTGVPWLGRGRALHPQELAVGRSSLLSPAEGPSIGRARGFPPLGDTPQGRGATLPEAQPSFGKAGGLLVQPDDGERVGRARGLLPPAPEPKVGVARGAILTSLEVPHGQAPAGEATGQRLTETPATKQVCFVFFLFIYFFNIQIYLPYSESCSSSCVFTG